MDKIIKVLLVIPAYNEEKNLVQLMENIDSYTKNLSNKMQLDYIIINDGSTDNTIELCKKNSYNVINLICNLGIGGAVQTGYKYAFMNDYDITVQFDGDGQHDINSLENLLVPIIHNECSFVVGSRFMNENSLFYSTVLRRIGIKWLSFLLKGFGCDIKDVTSGYRAADKAVTAYFAQYYPSDYPEPEVLVQLKKGGYKIKEVPVNMFERRNGNSSITWIKSVYYMIKVTLAILYAGFQKSEE